MVSPGHCRDSWAFFSALSSPWPSAWALAFSASIAALAFGPMRRGSSDTSGGGGQKTAATSGISNIDRNTETPSTIEDLILLSSFCQSLSNHRFTAATRSLTSSPAPGSQTIRGLIPIPLAYAPIPRAPGPHFLPVRCGLHVPIGQSYILGFQLSDGIKTSPVFSSALHASACLILAAKRSGSIAH